MQFLQVLREQLCLFLLDIIDGGLKHYHLDVRNSLSMTDGLNQPLPLSTLSRVQASLEQVKLLFEGGGAGMSVESISLITKLEGGMAPFNDI